MTNTSLLRLFLLLAILVGGLCLRVEAKPRLAFQVYGVRDLCEKDFAGTLKAVKTIGFEGVETGRFYGCDAANLKALCADAGLELVALQLYPDTLVEPELAKTIAFCKDCGCRRINVAWFKGSAENLRDWQLLVNVLNHAAEVCAREGIAVGYHNHDQEFLVQHEGRPVCDWLFKNFSPLVKQEFDPGWCVLAGGDPVKWLDAHPGRNPTIHVMPAIRSDAKLAPGQAAVGSTADQADWPRILAAAEKGGTEWLVVKPTLFPAQLDDLKASYAFLKKGK